MPLKVTLSCPKDSDILKFVRDNIDAINSVDIMVRIKEGSLSLDLGHKTITDIDLVKYFLMNGKEKEVTDNDFYADRRRRAGIKNAEGDKKDDEAPTQNADFDFANEILYQGMPVN